MPKVKASKSRVHHKAVGNKEAVAAKAAATAAASAASISTPESMQQMKEQFGLEFEEDRVDKKDKRKIRHDKWMSKLEATYNPQKKKKKSASAQNQALSVDFGSFHDILSSIDPTKQTTGTSKGAKGSATATTTAAVSAAVSKPTIDHQQFTIHAESSKPLQSKKAKKKAAMQEILRFQNVLAHPAFKSNPLLTIQQHVKNTMEMAPPEPVAVVPGEPELMED
ncbi:hypothetical protein BG011_006327 [Mortierella polycephala]|uniref:Ribosome biogenesis protein SLX9 n=1 Tax=Mortierella polycephala TaxID=41804 RepID=A0A9P6TZ68_9FUNG|nr:hypothetical protein BG011_006327 [Mortierella polycephala]